MHEESRALLPSSLARPTFWQTLRRYVGWGVPTLALNWWARRLHRKAERLSKRVDALEEILAFQFSGPHDERACFLCDCRRRELVECRRGLESTLNRLVPRAIARLARRS